MSWNPAYLQMTLEDAHRMPVPDVSLFVHNYRRHTHFLKQTQENERIAKVARIRAEAYYIWLNTGREDAEANWFEAEQKFAENEQSEPKQQICDDAADQK